MRVGPAARHAGPNTHADVQSAPITPTNKPVDDTLALTFGMTFSSTSDAKTRYR
jgi:hypothetical protein